MEIWKYTMEEKPDEFGDFELKLPKGATILHVGIQMLLHQDERGIRPIPTPCIWALVEPEVETEPRRFRVLQTGQTIEGIVKFRGRPTASGYLDSALALEYLGTFFAGSYVWHLFERTGR